MSYLTGGNGSFHTNHGFFQEIPYDITAESMSGRPDLNNQSYNTLEILPGMDGFSGPPTLTQIPNYRPGSDTGITPLVASDRGFLRDLIKFGPGENPDAGYDHWLLEQQQNKIFRNDPGNITMTPASAETGQQRMAGMNPNIIKLLIG